MHANLRCAYATCHSPEGTFEKFQDWVEAFFQTDMHMDQADSGQRSSACEARMTGLASLSSPPTQSTSATRYCKQPGSRRADPYLSTLTGQSYRSSTNSDRCAESQEQYRLRQMRRDVIARGQRAFFALGQLIIKPKATSPTASSHILSSSCGHTSCSLTSTIGPRAPMWLCHPELHCARAQGRGQANSRQQPI